MTRTLLALLCLAVAAAPSRAADFPLGKTVQVELVKGGYKGTPSHHGYTFRLPMEQGDKFRFEVSPVGGAAMKLQFRTITASGNTIESASGKSIDFTMSRGAPGNSLTVGVDCPDQGKVNIRVTKIGDAVTAEPSDEVKKLKAENAELKKQLDAQAKELTEIKQLLRDLKKR